MGFAGGDKVLGKWRDLGRLKGLLRRVDRKGEERNTPFTTLKLTP